MKSLENDGFVTVPFPEDEGIVYVLSFSHAHVCEAVPFYVGESRRGMRRIADYGSAQFGAPTDFRVGTAVRMLRERGCKVFVSSKPHPERRASERELIARLRSQGFRLLNDEPSYNYKSTSKAAARANVETYVLQILSPSRAGAQPE